MWAPDLGSRGGMLEAAEAARAAPPGPEPPRGRAWRGREAPAAELIKATVREATARGQGPLISFAANASSVLHNGLGRHRAARDAAWRAFGRDQLGYGSFLVPELAEAASGTGDVTLARAALQWLSERTRVIPPSAAARTHASSSAAAAKC